MQIHVYLTFTFIRRTVVQSPAADGSVVAEDALAASHPRQAQQRLPSRVGRQGPRDDGQSRLVSERSNDSDGGVQLLRTPHDASVVADWHRALTPPSSTHTRPHSLCNTRHA